MVHKRHGGFTTVFEIIVISWRSDGAGKSLVWRGGDDDEAVVCVKTNRAHPQREKRKNNLWVRYTYLGRCLLFLSLYTFYIIILRVCDTHAYNMGYRRDRPEKYESSTEERKQLTDRNDRRLRP